MLEILNIIAGSLLVLYLPGYCWSLLLLPRGTVDGITRSAVALALSLTVVPLILFYGYLLGIPITRQSVGLILGITMVGTLAGLAAVTGWRQQRSKP